MKKRLLISNLLMTLLLLVSWNISAQEYHFTEGFAEGNTPDGWDVKDVSYSNSETNAANQIYTDQTYAAKMKTNAEDMIAWLQFPKVNGASTLSFWCKVKAPDLTPTVKIQTSTDGENWEDKVTNPEGLDLTNSSDFQHVVIPLNIEGEVIIRIHVQTTEGGSSGTGTLTVDDIQLEKPAAEADDVFLSELKVAGSMIDGFDFNQTSYTVEVTHAMDYTVTATTNNSKASLEITQVSNIGGTEAERTATVVVTGEDGTSKGTTTILFNQTDYWYKEGFSNGGGLEGWERHYVFQSSNIKLAGNLNLHGGEDAIRFLSGSAAGSYPDPGYLLSPKMKNVGTLTFWTGAEAVWAGQSLTVYIMKGDDSTQVAYLDDIDLEVAWQEVKVEINEVTDSIQIKIAGVCDINDESTSRIWMDDFLVTYYAGTGTNLASVSEAQDVSIYPIPAKDVLNLRMSDNKYQRLAVYNLAGQMVMDEMLKSGQKSINVKDLSKGIYVLSLSGAAGNYNTKFVKE